MGECQGDLQGCCETIATIPQGMTAIHWASMKGEDQVGLVGKMKLFFAKMLPKVVFSSSFLGGFSGVFLKNNTRFGKLDRFSGGVRF